MALQRILTQVFWVVITNYLDDYVPFSDVALLTSVSEAFVMEHDKALSACLSLFGSKHFVPVLMCEYFHARVSMNFNACTTFRFFYRRRLIVHVARAQVWVGREGTSFTVVAAVASKQRVCHGVQRRGFVVSTGSSWEDTALPLPHQTRITHVICLLSRCRICKTRWTRYGRLFSFPTAHVQGGSWARAMARPPRPRQKCHLPMGLKLRTERGSPKKRAHQCQPKVRQRPFGA